VQISNEKLKPGNAKMKPTWAKMAITTPYLHKIKETGKAICFICLSISLFVDENKMVSFI